MQDRHSTAIHEAGHAVIARVLGLTCGSATIIPNEDEDEAGHALIADPWKTASDWDQALMEAVERGGSFRCHDARSAFRGRIIAMMAGAEAENELLGRCSGGDWHDRTEIEWMAASRATKFPDDLWQRYEPRMRRQTRRLVHKHRDKIERIAAALLEHDTLHPDEIETLIMPARR